MRILGISETCDLGSLYMRLLGEGHEVRVTVSEPLAQRTMAGLVPRAQDWRAELDWVRGAGPDGVILFEAVGFGALQDELRAGGYNVIGGSAFGDRLENERGFAQHLLGDFRLNIAPFAEFTNAADALAELRARPRRCVFKVAASAGETFVGAFDDGSDIAALLATRETTPGERFILMDHVEGVEVGVGAYFDGENFIEPACIDFEHKRFFDGDRGELTGEMGTVASFSGAHTLFNVALKPLTPQLREAGHVGYVNLNTIVTQAGVWPLEFTCRFGYPGFAVLEPLQGLGWGELFRRMIARSGATMPVGPGFSVCIVLSTPPFPSSLKELSSPIGLPVMGAGIEPEHLHWGEVGLANGVLVTSGLYGWTAVVTGTGERIGDAAAAAYARAGKVQATNIRYRLDIGQRVARRDWPQLAEWGWLEA